MRSAFRSADAVSYRSRSSSFVNSACSWSWHGEHTSMTGLSARRSGRRWWRSVGRSGPRRRQRAHSPMSTEGRRDGKRFRPAPCDTDEHRRVAGVLPAERPVSRRAEHVGRGPPGPAGLPRERRGWPRVRDHHPHHVVHRRMGRPLPAGDTGREGVDRPLRPRRPAPAGARRRPESVRPHQTGPVGAVVRRDRQHRPSFAACDCFRRCTGNSIG